MRKIVSDERAFFFFFSATILSLLLVFFFLIYRRHGWGCERVQNPKNNSSLMNVYIGTYQSGLKNGEGRKYYDNGIYDGSWKNDKRCGLGIMWFNDGTFYMGEWNSDKFHGHGVFVKGIEII
jgi:MORN repeat